MGIMGRMGSAKRMNFRSGRTRVAGVVVPVPAATAKSRLEPGASWLSQKVLAQAMVSGVWRAYQRTSNWEFAGVRVVIVPVVRVWRPSQPELFDAE